MKQNNKIATVIVCIAFIGLAVSIVDTSIGSHSVHGLSGVLRSLLLVGILVASLVITNGKTGFTIVLSILTAITMLGAIARLLHIKGGGFLTVVAAAMFIITISLYVISVYARDNKKSIHYSYSAIPSIDLSLPEPDLYVGSYINSDLPMKITITRQNNTLIGQTPLQQPFRLDNAGGSVYRHSINGSVFNFDHPGKSFVMKQQGKEFLFLKQV